MPDPVMADPVMADEGVHLIVRRTFFEVADVPSQNSQGRAMSAPPKLWKSEEERADQEPDSPRNCHPDDELDVLGQDIDIDRKQDPAQRTSVSIRHLPHEFTRDKLLELLDSSGFQGTYNFVYLPIHYRSFFAYGNAIVNFMDAKTAEKFEHHQWRFPCGRRTANAWAQAQGLEELVELYRNTPVMHDVVPDECKPVIFGEAQRLPFPPPTKKVPKPRSMRTCSDPGTSNTTGKHSVSRDARCEIMASPLCQGLEVEKCEPLGKAQCRSDFTTSSARTNGLFDPTAVGQAELGAARTNLLLQGLEWVDDRQEKQGHRQKACPLMEERMDPRWPTNWREREAPRMPQELPSAARASLLFAGLEQVESKECNSGPYLGSGNWHSVQQFDVETASNRSSGGIPSSKSLSIASCSPRMQAAGYEKAGSSRGRISLGSNVSPSVLPRSSLTSNGSFSDVSSLYSNDALPPSALACALVIGTAVEIIGAYPSGETGKVVALDNSQARVKVRLKHGFGIKMYNVANVRPVLGRS